MSNVMMVFVKFDANWKVIAQYKCDHAPEPNLMNVTDRRDGPNYMGRIYASRTDTFSTPPPPPPPTRRQQLKAKSSWTPDERDEAIRELL